MNSINSPLVSAPTHNRQTFSKKIKSIIMNKAYFPIVIIMLFASCKKESNENKDVIKYNSLTSLTSVSDQKSAYATLSPSEKTSMWQIHIDNMIKENEYNSVQLKLITEAKELLTLAKDVNDNDFVNSNEFIIWNHKAAEAFTKQEMFNLFVSLSGDVTQNLVDDGKNSCNCATQSDWCNFPAPPPDSWFYSSCDGGSNCKTKSGCGTLWRYDCNNTCEVHSIIPV